MKFRTAAHLNEWNGRIAFVRMKLSYESRRVPNNENKKRTKYSRFVNVLLSACLCRCGWVDFWPCVCEWVCVCVRDRERENVCERERVCVCICVFVCTGSDTHKHTHTHTHTHLHQRAGVARIFLLFILVLCTCVCDSVRAWWLFWNVRLSWQSFQSSWQSASFSSWFSFFALYTGPWTTCHP